MARSTDPIGAPNVLASSRAPAQADIEIIDVNSTNNVLIGNPLGFRKVTSQFACVCGGIMAERISWLIGEHDRAHTRKRAAKPSINRHSRDSDDGDGDDSSYRGDRDRGTTCDDDGDDAANCDGDGDHRGHPCRIASYLHAPPPF